jgi:hypothetical protein
MTATNARSPAGILVQPTLVPVSPIKDDLHPFDGIVARERAMRAELGVIERL